MMKLELPVRKRNRLEYYNYAEAGKYFVTICVANRVAFLWEDLDEHGEYWALSKYGRTVEQEIEQIHQIYPGVSIDKYCIMPDHIHMILSFEKKMCRGELCSPADGKTKDEKSPDLSRVIKQLKGSVTKKLGFSMWQKTYYDHVIRNEAEYARVWKYIDENPMHRLNGESHRNDLTFL